MAEPEVGSSLSLLDLPEEVRAVMINKLPQDYAFLLREVCQQLREDVDIHFGFFIRMYDYKEESVRRYVSFKIRHLELMAFQQGPETYIPLEFPNVLKTLTADLLMMNPDKFHLLLAQVAKNLVALDLRSEVIFFPPTTTVANYLFNHLKTLKLRDGFLPNRALRPRPILPDQRVFLNHLAVTTLRRLVIDFILVPCQIQENEVCSIWTVNILNLIGNCSRSLEDIKIHLLDYCTDNQGHGSKLQTVDLVKLHTVTNIKNVSMALDLKDSYRECFFDLLLQQSGIEVLKMSDDCSDTLYPAGLHRQLILNSTGSLREISISDFGNSGTSETDGRHLPFDMRAFQECHGLKIIKLMRNLNKRPRAPPQQMTAELIMVDHLPNNLVSIELIDFTVGTDDLYHFFTRRRSIRLIERVSLRVLVPAVFGLGVEFQVFDALLTLPRIKHLQIDSFSFPVPQTDLEWEALSQRVDDYQLPFDAVIPGVNPDSNYPSHAVYMIRDTVESPWRKSYN